MVMNYELDDDDDDEWWFSDSWGDGSSELLDLSHVEGLDENITFLNIIGWNITFLNIIIILIPFFTYRFFVRIEYIPHIQLLTCQNFDQRIFQVESVKQYGLR